MENNVNNTNTNTNTNAILPISLIHYIFDTYVGIDYKLLIHKEGSSDEDRSKVLSIELIMISMMEDYFKVVLLCNCLLYTSPSPRDRTRSRMPSSA